MKKVSLDTSEVEILTYLFSVCIGFPFCDTILFCHVVTLRHHLFVVPDLWNLSAALLREVLLNWHARLVWCALHPHLALGVGQDVTLDLRNVGTNLSDVNMFSCLWHKCIRHTITKFRLRNILTKSTWGQFHQPNGTKQKCPGVQYLVQQNANQFQNCTQLD